MSTYHMLQRIDSGLMSVITILLCFYFTTIMIYFIITYLDGYYCGKRDILLEVSLYRMAVLKCLASKISENVDDICSTYNYLNKEAAIGYVNTLKKTVDLTYDSYMEIYSSGCEMGCVSFLYNLPFIHRLNVYMKYATEIELFVREDYEITSSICYYSQNRTLIPSFVLNNFIQIFREETLS